MPIPERKTDVGTKAKPYIGRPWSIQFIVLTQRILDSKLSIRSKETSIAFAAVKCMSVDLGGVFVVVVVVVSREKKLWFGLVLVPYYLSLSFQPWHSAIKG
jgi:hypothetical protein